MSHPKIPPNCPYLMEDKYGCVYLDIGRTADAMMCQTQDHDDWRKAIACVARSYWLDEADDCRNFDAIAELKADAEHEASAWKKWGEGEEK